MVLGLIWAGIGLVYLACVTKSFRNPVPQYEDVAYCVGWRTLTRPP
jgi:hypothetical protein